MGKEKINKSYFVKVVEKEKPIMFRIVYGILGNVQDTEDVVSEAILKAWENRHKVLQVEKLGGWLVQISINLAKTMYQKRKKTIAMSEVLQDQPAYDGDVDMWILVNTMPKKIKDVVILYYYNKYSVNEVAEILSIPVGTVKSRLSKARNQLKEWMEA